MASMWLFTLICTIVNIDEISACKRTTYAADIVFLIDSSGSVGKTNFAKQLNFVKHLAQTVPIGPEYIQIGITTFSTKPILQFDLDDFTNKTDLVAAIDNVPYDHGWTKTAEALQYILNSGFTNSSGNRENIEDILIVTTDGESNNKTATLEVAKKLHAVNMTCICIGIGKNVKNEEIDNIASSPENAVYVTDFDEMVSTVLNLTLKKVEQYACPDQYKISTEVHESSHQLPGTLTLTPPSMNDDIHIPDGTTGMKRMDHGMTNHGLLLKDRDLKTIEIVILCTVSIILIGFSICCCRHLLAVCKTSDDDDDEDKRKYIPSHKPPTEIYCIPKTSKSVASCKQSLALSVPSTEVNDSEW